MRGWLEELDRGWKTHTIAHIRAKERERRLQELERWKLDEIVAFLPTLIQGSLLLFCTGLIVLLFPLHLPSAILCSITFVSVVVFYCFTLYVPIVNEYSPFSSPMSRLLAGGLAILRDPVTHIASIRFHNHTPLHPKERQTDADTSNETTRPVPSNSRVAKPMQPNKPDGVEKSKVVSHSRFGNDPHTHVHVLERLVLRTAEAVENIPIFLELLDQPVKYPSIRPFNEDKWKGLLHITFGLLSGQPTLPVSAAWTLARIMMVCYNHKTANRQLCLTLQHHICSGETDDQRRRVPLNMLFSSYLRSWFDLHWDDLWRTISFLEPSDAADAELFWMVNTFHKAIQSEGQSNVQRAFFVAVLTYVSSTEQCRRSKVPLTAAVIYTLHTMKSALNQGGINYTDRLCILPGSVSIPGSVPTTFCAVDRIDELELWSESGVKRVKDLLKWDQESYDIQFPLISALYIDSTQHAHARPIFANLLKYARTPHIQPQNSNAYDRGKLATYWYMALSQTPLDQDRDHIAILYDVIENTITEHSTLQLPGLHILEIAVKHVQKTAPRSSDWLERLPFGLKVIAPDTLYRPPLFDVDHWVLLHLDTLLAPQPYLLPEEVKELEWSDTPMEVHVAKARLDLYDSLAKAEHDGSNGAKPDPELLKVFLWSKDHGVCTRAFKWCLDLVSISQPGPSGGSNSTSIFIPGTLRYEWVEHVIRVLCEGGYRERAESWRFLLTNLVPKWTTLPTSWCRDFASALLFTIVRPLEMYQLPAYQCLAETHPLMLLDERRAFLPFLATLLKRGKSSLSWVTLTALENWLAQLPDGLENQDAHTKLSHLLATRKPQLTLRFFEAELAMAVTVASL